MCDGLRQIEIADVLSDLRIPPGNRLEALKGDRIGQHSVRINDRAQAAYDTEVAEVALAKTLKKIRPWSGSAA